MLQMVRFWCFFVTDVMQRTGFDAQGMHNTAWKKEWRKVGILTDPKFCRGPRSLKHTFGRIKPFTLLQEDCWVKKDLRKMSRN